MKIKAIIENLTRATGKKISYEEIGKAIGTTKSNVGYLVKRNSDIPEERIKEIEKYFKTNLAEVKNETTDIDLQQIIDLYLKFRNNKNLESGKLLNEKIQLMIRILESQQ